MAVWLSNGRSPSPMLVKQSGLAECNNLEISGLAAKRPFSFPHTSKNNLAWLDAII
ncbi:MAG: hypothetical protein M5U34_29245 [Chloroflexi bacterium]|nr:hypothetical protein [Chloroflexota bacterium]